MTARLLMIALDGADGTLLDRWSADGTLPNLAGLRARGATARLSAPEGVTDDALWASFQYAAGLGEHGRYNYLQRLDSGQMGMIHRDEANRETFWDTLSSRGQRIAVLDVPKCRLPRPINGIHLADWLVHGRYFREPRSYPESLAAEVIERFGPAPPSRCDHEGPPLTDAEVLEVTASLRRGVAAKRAAGIHYLTSEPWDLFVIGFKEAHCAGHRLWNLVDARHADHNASRAARLGEPLRTIIQDLDAAVGHLVAAAGPDAVVVAFSTTDIEPNSTLAHLMPEIVSRLNRRLGDTLLVRALRRVRRGLSVKSSKPPCELLPYNENCSALRVRPETLAEVESMLGELVDAETGRPVVAAMDRPSGEHAGARAAALPDLLVRYAAGTFPGAVVSPQLGRIEAERPMLRPGNHAPGGFLVMAGAGVACVSTMQDFGPMAARTLGVAI